MEGNSYIDLERRGTTLFPMTNKKAAKVIEVINEMKKANKDRTNESKNEISKNTAL